MAAGLQEDLKIRYGHLKRILTQLYTACYVLPPEEGGREGKVEEREGGREDKGKERYNMRQTMESVIEVTERNRKRIKECRGILKC